VSAAFGSTAVSSFVLADDSTWEGGSTTGLSTNVGYVTSRKGGAVSVIIFGQTSGLTATATFTLNPTIAVSTSPFSTANAIGSTEPSIAINRSASTIYMSGRNWLDEVDILANTIALQLSCVNHLTQHGKVTTSTSGAFNNVSVTYFDDLPTLPVTVIANSVSFNLESGNLIAPGTLLTAQQGVTKPLELMVPIGGGLVASDPGRPDFLQVTSTTITHNAGGARTLAYVWAINGPASTAWGVDWDTSGQTVTLSGITTTNSYGAGLAFISQAANAIPGGTSSSQWAFDDHDVLGTGAMASAASLSITVNPYVVPTTSTRHGPLTPESTDRRSR